MIRLEKSGNLSYQEYREISEYALKRLGLTAKFDILKYDTSTFIEVTLFERELIKAINKENMEKLDKLEYKDSGSENRVGEMDSYIIDFNEPRERKLDIYLSLEKKKKEGLLLVPEKALNIHRRLVDVDFIILVNTNVIDTYVRKESKLICIVHEVLHYAQDKGLVSQDRNLKDLDDFAGIVVKEFMEKNAETFIGDMV